MEFIPILWLIAVFPLILLATIVVSRNQQIKVHWVDIFAEETVTLTTLGIVAAVILVITVLPNYLRICICHVENVCSTE